MNTSLYDELVKLIKRQTIYLRHYDAQVLNNDSSVIGKNGWLKVSIPELNWLTEDQSQWVSPREYNRLIVPKIGDWVEIYFIGGSEDRPVWIGRAQYISDQEMINKKSDVTQHILFESPNGGKCPVLYDEQGNEMTIGDKDYKEVARKGDTSTSDNSIDSAFWIALNAHTHSTPAGPSGPAQGMPSSLKSQINSGSTQIKVGDK